jgi:hypothetical protein
MEAAHHAMTCLLHTGRLHLPHTRSQCWALAAHKQLLDMHADKTSHGHEEVVEPGCTWQAGCNGSSNQPLLCRHSMYPQYAVMPSWFSHDVLKTGHEARLGTTCKKQQHHIDPHPLTILLRASPAAGTAQRLQISPLLPLLLLPCHCSCCCFLLCPCCLGGRKALLPCAWAAAVGQLRLPYGLRLLAGSV